MATEKVRPEAWCLPGEEWRPVVGYEGLYEVSDAGRIRSLDREVPLRIRLSDRPSGERRFSDGPKGTKQVQGRIISGDTMRGYHRCTLYAHAKGSRKSVHRVVAEAFLPDPGPPPPIGYWTVNHKDGNKANNRVSNLEWMSCAMNRYHAIHNGLHARGVRTRTAKLEPNDVVEIRERYAQGHVSQMALARTFGLDPSTVRAIVYGHSWKHVGGPIVKPGEVPRYDRPGPEGDARVASLADDGLCQQAIAREIGRSAGYVKRALRRHRIRAQAQDRD